MVAGTRSVDPDADLEKLASVVELTELDLTACGSITDKGVAHLLSLSGLKSLNLSSCRRLTPGVFDTLRQMKSLESFSAEQVGWANDISPLADLPQLTSLSLARNTSFRGQGLRGLTGLTIWIWLVGEGSLETLEWSRSRV